MLLYLIIYLGIGFVGSTILAIADVALTGREYFDSDMGVGFLICIVAWPIVLVVTIYLSGIELWSNLVVKIGLAIRSRRK